jgi:hypothetical protein
LVEELDDFELGDLKKKVIVGSQLSQEIKKYWWHSYGETKMFLHEAMRICQGYLFR